MSIQDDILSECKNGKPVTVFLMNGYQQKGVILDFDQYVITMVVDGKTHMIYKHAISTIVH